MYLDIHPAHGGCGEVRKTRRRRAVCGSEWGLELEKQIQSANREIGNPKGSMERADREQ